MQDTSGPSDFASDAATPSSQQGDPLAGSAHSGSLHSQKSGQPVVCDVFLKFLVILPASGSLSSGLCFDAFSDVSCNDTSDQGLAAA